MSGRQYMGHRSGTLRAGADLSAKTLRYTFVKLSSTQGDGLTAGGGDRAIGVQQNLPENNKALNYALIDGGGTTKLRANGAVAVGDLLVPSPSGRATSISTAGAEYFAVAKEAAGAQDEIIEAFLCRGQV